MDTDDDSGDGVFWVTDDDEEHGHAVRLTSAEEDLMVRSYDNPRHTPYTVLRSSLNIYGLVVWKCTRLEPLKQRRDYRNSDKRTFRFVLLPRV
jgi:hypothetical protein